MLNNQHFADFRAKSLGGSDVAAILGLSPYRSAIDVWMEKTGKPIEHKDSLPLRFGSFAEEFVAQEYATRTGKQLINYPFAITHPNYEYFGGHIDRFVSSNPREQCAPALDHLSDDLDNALQFNNQQLSAIHHQPIERLLECKTANPFMQQQWGDSGTDQVPLPYLCQCLWYMAITGVDKTDLAVLFGNADFRIYSLERDLEIENTLLEKAQFFWTEYVQKDLPPPVQNERDCHKLFTKTSCAKSIEAPTELVTQLAKVATLQAQMEVAENELSQIKQLVMSTMQDAEVLSYAGKTLATWKLAKGATRIDSKRLEKDHPQLAAQYQITAQASRRLLLKSIAE